MNESLLGTLGIPELMPLRGPVFAQFSGRALSFHSKEAGDFVKGLNFAVNKNNL